MFNAKQLTRRDLALAALVGAVSGADFGYEASQSSGFAEPSGFAQSSHAGESSFGWEGAGADGFFGADGGFFGGESFGNDFGAEAALTAPMVTSIPKPTEQQALALWRSHHQMQAKQAKRGSLLYPNHGVDHKVQRYQLNVSQSFAIGTATVLNNLTRQPDTSLRPQRILANVPVPVLVFYSEIKVANVSVTQGDAGDAYFLNALAWGTQFDIPTLSPANRVTVLANSTTFVPGGFMPGNTFPLVFSFIGPASEVA